MQYGLPEKHGLYDPANEKDACGVGFVAQIKGVASHQIVKDANRILCNMDHRGARGSETNTGDGAGMLTAVPDKLLRRAAKEELGIVLPEPGKYGVGNIFLPTDDEERAYCKAAFLRAIEAQGQRFLGWREVPTDPDGANLGPTALQSMPRIEQLFIGAAEGLDADAFERQLYVIRKSAASPLRVDESLKQRSMLYACSLSSRTIIYKGMLACEQVLPFYGDLTDPEYETHLAMVHSRFATNTFPTWERAQPLRCLSHNGEINTLRGNKNAMHSRQGVVESELYGDDLRKLFPVAEPGLSDSGTLDNVLEFLYMNGRTMPAAAMMMIPEAWQRHEHMPQLKRDFYEYQSCLMEPWDGPASIAFTDGTVIGAVLDRNGLRPSRYYLTHDDRVIMASEVGVLPVPPETVKHKGRLKPGRMFLIDFEQGRMIPDDELKNDYASRLPYGDWLREQRLKLTKLPVHGDAHGFEPETLLARMQSFGYTTETMQFMLRPMIEQK
ncbi:MAG: glutamate synthase subunit alpha, partial [Polyangiales bacterium]